MKQNTPYMALLTTSFPSGGGFPTFVITQASANPTGMPLDTAGLFAKDVGGTCHLFGIDEAGNVNQLTAHAMDGPEWLYDHDEPHPDRVVCSENQFTGTKEWINESRKARLLERLFAGEDVSLLPVEERTIRHVVAGLPRQDWDANQQFHAEKRRRDIERQQAEWAAFDLRLEEWQQRVTLVQLAKAAWELLPDEQRSEVPCPVFDEPIHNMNRCFRHWSLWRSSRCRAGWRRSSIRRLEDVPGDFTVQVVVDIPES